MKGVPTIVFEDGGSLATVGGRRSPARSPGIRGWVPPGESGPSEGCTYLDDREKRRDVFRPEAGAPLAGPPKGERGW